VAVVARQASKQGLGQRVREEDGGVTRLTQGLYDWERRFRGGPTEDGGDGRGWSSGAPCGEENEWVLAQWNGGG